MHILIARQSWRSLRRAAPHLRWHDGVQQQSSRALWWNRAAAAAAGHGGESGASAAAAAWQQQQAPLPATAACAAQPAAAAGERATSTRAQQLPHLHQLSGEQLAAVTAPLGTLRVVAGPGSGKTRVLTARIAQLICAHGAQPWQVLAITFTNKAANEMRERLAEMLGEEVGKQLFAGTFHSLCYRILKSHIADLPGTGRTPGFAVYDQDMSLRLLAREVRKQQPDWKGKDVNDKARAMQSAISKAKSSMLTWHAATPQAVEQSVREHLALAAVRGGSPGQVAAADDVAEWFGKYEAALQANNAVDFDDLLGLTVALLRDSEAVRQRYQRRFRHVLVDEFQDTNSSQYELVKLLSLPRADLFVVGDPDQSIYGWRGADMNNMTCAFGADFPQTQVCDLRDNYRSCARIVATAQHVIAANDDWQRAGLRARRPAGHPIEVHVLRDSQAEARFIVGEIEGSLARREHPEEQVAVLFRTHVQARLVEQELVRRGLAYVLIGGVPFWQRMEVQDVIAYLRLAVSLRDDVALARIINTPRRGIGDSSAEKLQAAAATQGQTLSAFLFGPGGSVAAGSSGNVAGDRALPPLPDRKELGLPAKTAAALEAFRELMAGLHAAVCSQPLGRVLAQIVAKTGYEQFLLDGGCTSSTAKEDDERERLKRVHQLVAAASGYEPGQLSGAAALDVAFNGAGGGGMAAYSGGSSSSGSSGSSNESNAGHPTPLQLAQNFLDEAALYSGMEEGGASVPGVRLMTMHAAKGLEFEMVFIPGCNDGLMPLVRSIGDLPMPDSLAEERRLFYVSLTRAKHRLHLTHTLETSHYGPQSRKESKRSRFLFDVLKAGHAVLLGAEDANSAGLAGLGSSRKLASSWQHRSFAAAWYGRSSRQQSGSGGSSTSSTRASADQVAPGSQQLAPLLSATQERAKGRGGQR